MSETIETKLGAARTRLILDRPFLGALVLRLPLVAADPRWCPTTATDARALYYNPDYFAALDLRQTEFALAHEALHCALSHFSRRRHRQKGRWDLACDLAINPLLVAEGLTPVPGALLLPQFDGMTAEEIYPCLEEHPEQKSHDRHLYDNEEGEGSGEAAQGGRSGSGVSRREEAGGGGGGRPPPLTAEERERLTVQWRQRMAGAAQQALQAGKLGGALARLVDHLLQPQLPWRMLLARYMSAVARDDYNYSRPSTRREGPAIHPSLRSAQLDVVVAVDTSGSIGTAEIGAFLAEVEALKGQVRARVTLHACDAELAAGGPWCYEPWEPLVAPRELTGGGGTRFTPVFEWVERDGRRPDLLLYFTDAEGEFPRCEPPYPVVWLVKGRGRVPWGQRIQLN